MKFDRAIFSAIAGINVASGEIAVGDVTNVILLPRGEKNNTLFEIDY